MNSEQLREFYEQNFYYLIGAGIGIGLLFGVIPLAFGVKRKKPKLGIIALLCSGVAGGFSPLLGAVVAAVFLVLVLRKAKIETPAGESESPQTLSK